MLELEGGKEHPSRWTITRAFTGDMPGDEAGQVMEHAMSCKQCSSVLAGLEIQKKEFETSGAYSRVKERLALETEENRPGKVFAPRFAAAAAVFAAAAAILLVFLPMNRGGLDADGADGNTRTKGSSKFELGLVAMGKNGPIRVESGTPLEPGTRVQVVFDAHGKGYLYVVSLDDRGKVTSMAPAAGKPARYVDSNREQPLQNSFVLDDAKFERVFGLLCPKPLESGRIETSLSGLLKDKGDVRSIRRLPLDCEQAYIDLPRRLP